MDFTKITKKIWSIYLDGTEEEFELLKRLVAPDCVIIGTGKHEFYQNFNAFSEENPDYGYKSNGEDLHIRNYWCEQKQVGEDMFLVYGELSFFREDESGAGSCFMESRFSVVYKLIDGEWKIIHIHQSVPNAEQAAGEYYPKTLLEQIREEKEKVNVLEELANKDGLTGLYNYRAFCDIYENADQSGAWILVADIDDFKLVNDRYGHLQGNRVLKRLAHSLSAEAGESDVICRMGGDEFIILCKEPGSEEAVSAIMERLRKRAEAECSTEDFIMRISIGAAPVSGDETIENVLQRADEALYRVKKNGKNGCAVF